MNDNPIEKEGFSTISKIAALLKLSEKVILQCALRGAWNIYIEVEDNFKHILKDDIRKLVNEEEISISKVQINNELQKLSKDLLISKGECWIYKPDIDKFKIDFDVIKNHDEMTYAMPLSELMERWNKPKERIIQHCVQGKFGAYFKPATKKEEVTWRNNPNIKIEPSAKSRSSCGDPIIAPDGLHDANYVCGYSGLERLTIESLKDLNKNLTIKPYESHSHIVVQTPRIELIQGISRCVNLFNGYEIVAEDLFFIEDEIKAFEEADIRFRNDPSQKNIFPVVSNSSLVIKKEDEIETQEKRKKLKLLQRKTNTCLTLIYEITKKYNITYLDELDGLSAWTKIISEEFKSSLIKEIKKEPKHAQKITLVDREVVTKKDFLNKYRTRFNLFF